MQTAHPATGTPVHPWGLPTGFTPMGSTVAPCPDAPPKRHLNISTSAWSCRRGPAGPSILKAVLLGSITLASIVTWEPHQGAWWGAAP